MKDWQSVLQPFILVPLCQQQQTDVISSFEDCYQYESLIKKHLIDSLEFQQASLDEFCDLIVQVIDLNAHIAHLTLIDAYLRSFRVEATVTEKQQEFARQLSDHLQRYIAANQAECANNARIKCERAYLILSDLCVLYSDSTDDANSQAMTYRSKIDVLENEDFSDCMYQVLLGTELGNNVVQWCHGDATIRVECPMKVALSSANNSDRYGAAKLEGSKVLNMAVNVKSYSSKSEVSDGDEISAPIRAYMKRIDEPKIIFEAYNDMGGEFRSSRLVIDENNHSTLRQFLCVAENKEYNVSNVFTDSKDPFRFYKYALAFSGIVQCFEYNHENRSKKTKAEYLKDSSLIWRDLMHFTQGKGLILYLSNNGPSKSGFSSSSAVMTTLLALCYRSMSGDNSVQMDRLYDLALLAENELGLRSGWNDTYTVMPGIHDFITLASDRAPEPRFSSISSQLNTQECCHWFERHLWLIHTGVQRKATGRMNRRHEVYLSRSVDTFPYLVKSITIHDKIAQSLLKRDSQSLGEQLTEYMSYRVAFDPQATSPHLQYLFQFLHDRKLIHGGLLAGAMGGGIAQIIVTDYALEKHTNKQYRIESAIEELKCHTFDNGEQPFNNSLFGRIEFSINRRGIHVFIEGH